MRISRVLLAVAVLAGPLTWANWPAKPLPAGTKGDRIVIVKSSHTLRLMNGGAVLREYRVSLGRHSVGPKEREGDGKTPEGLYRIAEHKRDSAFHRALKISYPEPRDLARATTDGVAPGSNIMIHGIRNRLGWIGRLHRLFDWTAGCIALTDPEVEELWGLKMERLWRSLRDRNRCIAPARWTARLVLDDVMRLQATRPHCRVAEDMTAVTSSRSLAQELRPRRRCLRVASVSILQ